MTLRPLADGPNFPALNIKNNFDIQNVIPIPLKKCSLRKPQLILGKALLRRNGNPLSSSNNAAQNQLVLSRRARFKEAYTNSTN
tara:strand:+ start:25960 stop:26211 length:252 start_codon:yes stop_codon:yes gene_type:complete